MTKVDPLFVLLATGPYTWFESGAKRWEVRRMVGGFSLEYVRVGRRVELRRGYSTADSIWGYVAEVEVAESLAALYQRVPYRQVVPLADCRDEAIDMAASILGIGPNELVALIAFRVERDESEA